MKHRHPENAFVFIVGSPRSGTSLLGEILDRHDLISQWFEPYFVWDHYFRNHPDDVRSDKEATPRVVNQIRKDFFRYLNYSQSTLVVDKSPRNSLKIPFIRKIFPEARFIHLLRDGRDVTLSIHKEWLRRNHIVNDPSRRNRFNYAKAFQFWHGWLDLQPLLQDKLRAIWFETNGHFIDTSKHLNRTRWNGAVGWGPRFRNWQRVFAEKSNLEFNAYQWLKCIESIHDAWEVIPQDKKLDIRYEELIEGGRQTITKIINFLGLEATDRFLSSLPVLKRSNTNKWQQAFSKNQMDEISPILNPMLNKLGY